MKVFNSTIGIGVGQTLTIDNTAFGISGSLPAFAATPTFNIGAGQTLTANAGTNLNTSLLALESGGNLASINTKLPASLAAKTAAGSLSIAPAYAPTPTLTNIAAGTSSVTLIASNIARKTLIITNDSTGILYIKMDASGAGTSSYSVALPPLLSSVPSSLIIKGDDYSGEIRGIWSNTNGFARVTEVV
jgi:hypothetical protein